MKNKWILWIPIIGFFYALHIGWDAQNYILGKNYRVARYTFTHVASIIILITLMSKS